MKESKSLMQGAALWAGYYRENPQRFAKEYMNIMLRPFQAIMLYEMQHSNHTIMWACRGLGKTWILALFATIRCELYPHYEVRIVSPTRTQGNEVLLKIQNEFMTQFDWGSRNLQRDITACVINTSQGKIDFRNGSHIKVVTAGDSGRGNRANLIIIDEFPKVEQETITYVVKKFNGPPRNATYLNLPQYSGNTELYEPNKEMYTSSCWLESHWSYDKTKSYFVNMLGGRNGYFVCDFPYQLAVKEGLKSILEIEDEMSEADFDDIAFQMEMESLPLGYEEDSFFQYDDISKCRKLQNAVYPSNTISEIKFLNKVPKLATNERRILSVDIALMASSNSKNNDASSIIINSAIPNAQNEYVANLIYMQNYEGLNTDELALIVRKLFAEFKCTDLVVDTNGQGLGVYDALIVDMIDRNTNVIYPALTCCNDKAMAARCKARNAPAVIWSIKGNAKFNNEICLLLRRGIQKQKINLLVDEHGGELFLKANYKDYDNLTPMQQIDYKMPYIQTSLLVHELINLKCERNGQYTKVYETSGKRKDRYSSLAYNYWVQNQLERDLLKEKSQNASISQYVSSLKKLSKRPTTY